MPLLVDHTSLFLFFPIFGLLVLVKDRKIETFSQSFISSYSGYTSNMMVKDSDFGPSFLTVTSSFDKATVDTGSLSQTSSFVQDRGMNPERILDQHLRPGFNNVQFRQAFAQWFFVLGFALSRCLPLHNETQRSLFDSRLRSVDWYMYRRRICICRFPVSLDFNYASVTVDQLGLAFLRRTLVTLCSPTMAAYFFTSSLSQEFMVCTFLSLIFWTVSIFYQNLNFKLARTSSTHQDNSRTQSFIFLRSVVPEKVHSERWTRKIARTWTLTSLRGLHMLTTLIPCALSKKKFLHTLHNHDCRTTVESGISGALLCICVYKF